MSCLNLWVNPRLEAPTSENSVEFLSGVWFTECDDWEQISFYKIDGNYDKSKLLIQFCEYPSDKWLNIITSRINDFFLKGIYQTQTPILLHNFYFINKDKERILTF